MTVVSWLRLNVNKRASMVDPFHESVIHVGVYISQTRAKRLNRLRVGLLKRNTQEIVLVTLTRQLTKKS